MFHQVPAAQRKENGKSRKDEDWGKEKESMRIEPRKKKDRDGIIMMPLVKNVPVPKSDTWKKKDCPACGRACWKIPLPEGFKKEMFAGRLCTECAIKTALGRLNI